MLGLVLSPSLFIRHFGSYWDVFNRKLTRTFESRIFYGSLKVFQPKIYTSKPTPADCSFTPSLQREALMNLKKSIMSATKKSTGVVMRGLCNQVVFVCALKAEHEVLARK